MANVSMVREADFAQKKSESFFALRLDEGTESFELPVAGGDFLLGYLPPDCIITDAYVHVITVSDAVTSSVATLGTAEAGTEIMSAGDLKTAVGKEGTFTGQSLTGTGVGVYLNVTKVGGDGTAVGEVYVVVEYLEITKKSGEYTAFSL